MALRIFKSKKRVIPVIRIDGIIAASGNRNPRGSGVSLDSLRVSIDKAFAVPRAPFVALVINSPGGSPVQSALIGNYIRLKAKQHKIAVYAFCEDIAASGGYWLAASADKIYAMPASIVGSIGVIAAMFGFTQLIKKIGVERRVYTSGKSKNQFDSFLPENKGDVAHLQKLQKNIHQDFIDWVKQRRGKKLGSSQEIFSGKFWTGTQARALGLVDEIAGLDEMLSKKYGTKYQLKWFGAPKRSMLRWFGLEALGAFWLDALISRIDDRLTRAHFGL